MAYESDFQHEIAEALTSLQSLWRSLTHSVEPILGNGSRHIIRRLERIFDAQPVSVPSILIETADVDL